MTLSALDQLEDMPRPDEAIHVYRIVPGTWTFVYVRPGGRFEHGEYRYLPDAPVGQLRDTAAWRAWVGAQVEL
jgi:hypothetical protein